MATFTEYSRIQSEGEEGAIDAECRIEGSVDDDNPTEVQLDVRVSDREGHEVHLSYLFTDQDGDLSIKFITVGEPLTDYSLCLARKAGPAIVSAAIDCYAQSDGWWTFYKCMKQKAPGIGMRAARALLTCVGSIVGFDWD